MKHFSLAENIIERMKEVEVELGVKANTLSLRADEIDIWAYKNIHHVSNKQMKPLAASIENIGQLQPILVIRAAPPFKPQANPQAKYIIIDGYHRWKIGHLQQRPIQAIEKHLSISQAIEYLLYETSTHTSSDYAKGMFYYSLLKNGTLAPQALCVKTGMNLTRLNHLLSFATVPQCIWDAVGDLSNVSAKTASIIKSLADRSDEHYQALIASSQQIREGYAEKRLKKLINQKLGIETAPEDTLHYFKHHGDVLMSLKNNIITLEKNIVSDTSFDELVHKFETAIKEWQDAHNK